MSKFIAKSIKTLMDNPLVIDTLNRGSDMIPIAEATSNFWGYDLLKRKPSPAYDDYGLFQGTDLDLACFLYSMVGRGAVINIPRYKAMRQKKQRADQVVTSSENRHGKVVGVQANKDHWTFSINVIDENVISADKVGEFRTFSLTDLDGSWYDGWDKLEFVPTLNENKFITENQLWSGSEIVFKNMIHPNRWTSFFGHHYIITKMVIDRLVDESKFLNTKIKELVESGIRFPSDGSSGPKSSEYESYGDVKSIKKTAFQAMIYIPTVEYVGVYPEPAKTQAALIEMYDLRKKLQSFIKGLRFMSRATEYAHSNSPDNMPSWIKGVTWETGFKIPPRGRTLWERLPLYQTRVGEFSIAILRRWYEKSARVSADY